MLGGNRPLPMTSHQTVVMRGVRQKLQDRSRVVVSVIEGVSVLASTCSSSNSSRDTPDNANDLVHSSVHWQANSRQTPKDKTEVPKLVAALNARDQKLGIGDAVEIVE